MLLISRRNAKKKDYSAKFGKGRKVASLKNIWRFYKRKGQKATSLNKTTLKIKKHKTLVCDLANLMGV